MKHSLILSILFSVLLLSKLQAHETQEFKFGVVPQFNSNTITEIWKPVFEEIQTRTGYKLILEESSDIPDFEKKLKSGLFDFAYSNPYHIIMVKSEQEYVPFLRDGLRTLFGILVVRKDSPYKKVTDLDEKVISFPAPNAFGASLLMRAELSLNYQIAIRPSYVKTHTASYMNVFNGKADAAGGVMGTYNSLSPELREQLTILHRTKRSAPHPISRHSRIPEDVVKTVQLAFLEMAQEPDWQTQFAKIPIKQMAPTSLEEYQELSNRGIEAFISEIE